MAKGNFVLVQLSNPEHIVCLQGISEDGQDFLYQDSDGSTELKPFPIARITELQVMSMDEEHEGEESQVFRFPGIKQANYSKVKSKLQSAHRKASKGLTEKCKLDFGLYERIDDDYRDENGTTLPRWKRRHMNDIGYVLEFKKCVERFDDQPISQKMMMGITLEHVYIMNTENCLVLDVVGGGGAGTDVCQWEVYGGDNQLWNINYCPSTGQAIIFSVLHPDCCLEVRDDGGPGTLCINTYKEGEVSQLWRFFDFKNEIELIVFLDTSMSSSSIRGRFWMCQRAQTSRAKFSEHTIDMVETISSFILYSPLSEGIFCTIFL